MVCHMPLSIVQPLIDQSTVDALKNLLEEAQRGRIVGLAYIALKRGPDYSADVVGAALQHPLLTRGIAGALADAVAHHTKRR